MGQVMKPTTPSRSEAATTGSFHDRLDLLDAQLWERARRNLRVLYKGLTPASGPNVTAVVLPLAVAATKI